MRTRNEAAVDTNSRHVEIAGKTYAIDTPHGERRALAALTTHRMLRTAIFDGAKRTGEWLVLPDADNPPPRFLALIGQIFQKREVIAIKRAHSPSRDSYSGRWTAVVRCEQGHIALPTPGALTFLRPCGACYLAGVKRPARDASGANERQSKS